MTSTRRSNIQRVLIITLIANLSVAAAKITIGLVSSSLAMIADGVHSSLDSTSNIIGLIGNVLAGRPPDEGHPYGHRRFETLASMMIGGILLLTGWELVKSSIQRLGTHEAPQVTTISFVVMLTTLAVNIVVMIYESREGKRFNSEFLLADAAHTRSDILVSLTVIASLIAVKLGLTWIDPIAAMVVVILIAVVAWNIVRNAAAILVDRAALDAGDVTEIVEGVAGVQGVSRVRSRGPADEVHLDLDVQVAGPTTAEHTNAIAGEVRRQLRVRFTGLDEIQVNFVPMRDVSPDTSLIVRSHADALGLGAHEIISIPTPDGEPLALEMHVEVQPDQSVGQAHALVTELERRLKTAIPTLTRIVTHIEPAEIVTDVPSINGTANRLISAALQIAERMYPAYRWHDLEIRLEADGGYALSMHCHVSANMPLEEAHLIAEAVETQVRAELSEIHRVTIHTEPPDED